MKRIRTLALATCMGLGFATAVAAADEVDKSFFPYKGGFPSHNFVKPGVTITQSNVDQAKSVLDSATYETIKNGWYELKVGQTESIDVNPAYVEATRKGYANVSLGDKPGQINGYVAGRPFPQEPDVKDPRAGEKIAWNYKYGINLGDSAVFNPFYWTYKNMNDGAVERVVKMDMRFLNFMHRTMVPPMPNIEPNPSEMYRAIYTKVLQPQDIQDTQLLIHRYEDDTKLDSSWMYLGFQRRVRKLSTGQITDAFLGSDAMIEDFEGYNGRVSDMKWTFKGSRNILMPYFRHNDMPLTDEHAEPDFKFIGFGGKGGCFPNITWQLRKVYEVEVTPVDRNHPVSKRTMYFDSQMMGASRTLIYDRSGKLWKSFSVGLSMPNAHLPINKNSGIGIYDFFSMVDMQALHCTTGQVKGQADPAGASVERFAVDAMRSGK